MQAAATQRLLLDAGSRAGVHTGQTVIDAGGLMGQVISTTPGTATVLLLTPPLCWLPWREWRALSPAGGRASIPMQRALTAP